MWRALPHADLALRFRRDMAAARRAWIAAAQDSEERKRRVASNTLKYVYHDGIRNVYADVHGLRHTGITFVVRPKGVRVGQVWADHSTPTLTARYAHVDDADLTQAAGALPDTSKASPKTDEPNAAKERSTETDKHAA